VVGYGDSETESDDDGSDEDEDYDLDSVSHQTPLPDLSHSVSQHSFPFKTHRGIGLPQERINFWLVPVILCKVAHTKKVAKLCSM
jgi:hypothetical protein